MENIYTSEFFNFRSLTKPKHLRMERQTMWVTKEAVVLNRSLN